MTVKNNIIALSLFSGAGGLDLSSELAGVPVVLSTDFDHDCCKTLELNSGLFPEATVVEGDLHTIESSFLKGAIDSVAHDLFIVIGGAPCQPFSKAGYWVGEKHRGINDPRAALIDEYLRVIQDLEPDGFVFENVEQLLAKQNKPIVDGFIRLIEDCGYSYKIVKACALDYGVSQKRKRIFILGTKGEFKSDEPRKTHCPPEKVKETGLLPYVPVKEVIKGFDGPEFFEPEEVVEGGTYYKDLCEIPAGWNYKYLTEWAGHPAPKFIACKRFWSFLLKLSPDKPSWTITAQPGPWVGPFHWDNRRLRVPEIAAIQAFPKNYHFYGSRRSIQKQIGNAVPPLMGKAMIGYVKESLEDAERS